MRIRLLLLLALLAAAVPAAHAQQGDVAFVHDPSIIKSGDVFYLFSTGDGLLIRTSSDLFNWKLAGSVFKTAPEWTRPYVPRGNNLWAPDISFFNGQFHVYYAGSTFGSTHSCIGLATNTTLDPASPDYRWIDRGKVIDTPPKKSDWNALDPCAFVDDDQKVWLILGSCWTGIKLVPLDSTTGLLAAPDQPPLAIAARPRGKLLEEGYVRSHAGFYYLWISFDHCCRGARSDYKIVVGRSKNIQGPFVDREGVPMLQGGGTIVMANKGSVCGPGSSAIIHEQQEDFLVHHYYDADDHGIPKLQINPLTWDADGWPSVAEPISGPLTAEPKK
jgi:arabinan endo-1,5-alpha-L-arabinosidase